MAKTFIGWGKRQVRVMISPITGWLKGIGDELQKIGVNKHGQFYYINTITTNYIKISRTNVLFKR
jgi:hypothetical protein